MRSGKGFPAGNIIDFLKVQKKRELPDDSSLFSV